MTVNRLLLIQHGLEKTSGHWLRETREWRAAATAMGLQWGGLAHKNLDPDVAAGCGLAPVFPIRPRNAVKAGPAIDRLATFIEISDVFRNVCAQYLPADVGEKDLLYVSFSGEVEMFGVAKWLDGFPPEKRPSVAFFFHLGDIGWKVDAPKTALSGDVATWEYAARSLRLRLPLEKIKLYAANAPLARVLSQIFKVPTHALPIVSPSPPQLLRDYRQKTYDIATLGGARTEQGTELWPEIIMALGALRPGLKAAFQAKLPAQADIMRNIFAKRAPSMHVDILDAPLSENEYEERLHDCRLLLLPYLPEKYCLRESGVFCEAVGRAVPAAVPEFTSMARHIESGKASGIVYKNGDMDAIAATLDKGLKNIEEISKRADALSAEWATQHRAATILKRIVSDF